MAKARDDNSGGSSELPVVHVGSLSVSLGPIGFMQGWVGTLSVTTIMRFVSRPSGRCPSPGRKALAPSSRSECPIAHHIPSIPLRRAITLPCILHWKVYHARIVGSLDVGNQVEWSLRILLDTPTAEMR